MSKLYVFTLNWNGESLLKNMLPGLINNLKKLNIEYQICIRDNGSKDNSVELLKSDYKDIFILEKDHNRDSFSAGMNSLFELVSPNDDDLILLLNNDIVFLDDQSLSKMFTLMQKTNAAMVGARLMHNDNKTISHNGIIFSKKYGDMCWNYRSGDVLNNNIDLKNRQFQAITAACALVKAKNFKQAGLFDTNLHWAFEDVALCLEISINQKEKIICCGETNITHLTSESLKKNPVNKLFLSSNVKYFKNKWFGKYKLDHELYLNNPHYNEI